MTMATYQNRVPLFSIGSVDPVHRGGQTKKYTAPMTVGRLAELLTGDQIWVDYDYQRGVKVTYNKDGKEKRTPMVDLNRVDEIASKMLSNKLFGGSLTWNLRTDEVEFSYDKENRTLHIFKGKPTIPDSNHRHEAVKKVAELVQTRGYNFDLNAYEFPLVIEVLDLDGERGLFYEYNQLGKPANPTRSRFINQADLHNSLTSQIVESSVLRGHVELVTNNISRNSTKIATFNTLAKGIEEGFPNLDDSNYDVTKQYLIDFFKRLATIRPEMGNLDLSARKTIREKSIGDTALVVQTYVKIAGDLHEANIQDWPDRLSNLAKTYIHKGGWNGDLMRRDNPLWREEGVLSPTKSGAMSVTNRRQSRKSMHDTLRELVGIVEADVVPPSSPSGGSGDGLPDPPLLADVG